MYRKSMQDYSVPSLSLASSRSRRNIPTKDHSNYPPPVSSQTDRQTQYNVLSRPPIFSCKGKKQTKKEQQEEVQRMGLTRNVYLNREEGEIDASNKKSRRLLTEAASSRIVEKEVERKLELKKVDLQKSLFQRRVKKLLEEAQFYESEMNNYLPEDSESSLLTTIMNLEEQRRAEMRIDFGPLC